MLAKNLTITALSASPAFHFLFLFTQLSLGGMTDSHSVGPQVNFEDHEEDTVLQFHSQNTRRSLATLWENRNSLLPQPCGILCRFFAPRNQIPSIPAVPHLLLCKQLTHVSFLSLV